MLFVAFDIMSIYPNCIDICQLVFILIIAKGVLLILVEKMDQDNSIEFPSWIIN
jgi:hypothetical protein